MILPSVSILTLCIVLQRIIDDVILKHTYLLKEPSCVVISGEEVSEWESDCVPTEPRKTEKRNSLVTVCTS